MDEKGSKIMLSNLLMFKEEERKKREWRKKRLHWAMVSIVMFLVGVLTGINIVITITKGY
jgi:hypothetical protein